VDGHPYLTLRVFQSLQSRPPENWDRAAVDVRVQELFLGPGGEADSNLRWVRDMLIVRPINREPVLRWYMEVAGGKQVGDRGNDPVISWLKLSGVVRARDGALAIRNRVYAELFPAGMGAGEPAGGLGAGAAQAGGAGGAVVGGVGGTSGGAGVLLSGW
jgi:hypothetical protein